MLGYKDNRRKAVGERAFARLKAKCGYKENCKCCDTCYWIDFDEMNCERFCSNPRNEWKGAKGGEPCAFTVAGPYSVCKFWKHS